MTKFIIVIGRKYFSNYVPQSNYWIIQIKLLADLFQNSNEKKEYKKYTEMISLVKV